MNVLEATLAKKVREEMDRLRRSGGVTEDTPLNLIIGVALENVADNHMRDLRHSNAYLNLHRF